MAANGRCIGGRPWHLQTNLGREAFQRQEAGAGAVSGYAHITLDDVGITIDAETCLRWRRKVPDARGVRVRLQHVQGFRPGGTRFLGSCVGWCGPDSGCSLEAVVGKALEVRVPEQEEAGN